MEIIDIQPSGVPVPAATYSHICRAGDFLFLAGQTAADPATGKTVKGYEDLDEETRAKLATGSMHTDFREGPIVAQTWVIYSNIKKMLEEAGSSLDHIVQVRIYMLDLRDFPAFERVRKMFFKRFPPSTVVEVKRLGATDDVRIEIEVIAVVPSKKD